MKTRKNEESSKSKLSLQKKKETVVKKDWKNILSIPHNSLNETCEFKGNSRSKEQSKCQVTVTKETRNQVPVTVSKEARNQVSVTVSEEARNQVPVTVSEEARNQVPMTVSEEARNQVPVTVLEEGEVWNQVVEDCNSLKKCPTCETSMPLEVFQHHVRDCLKDRFQIKGTNEDEETRDKFVCQFCMKDLSYYNSTRKTQHLNRCMDQIDEMKQKETEKKKELEQARLAILDCPMCGKTLKTENGRKVHMKKCSQNLGVSTDQLLALIKQQEEERQVKLAAGEVPQSAKAGISKLNKQAKKQKLREPQSKYDEELQTALAISNSLCKTASTEKTETQAKKPGKKKGGDHVPAPLVVLLSEEEKQKRRSERVASMLIPQESEDDDDVESLTQVLPESQIQEKYTTGNNKLPSLWTRCKLSTGGPSCLENKDRFYVEELMPPIAVSRFVVGSSVKKIEDIPGRRKSSYQRLAEKQTVGSLGSTSLHGDTMLASTQTAVVLAELEVSAIATSDLDLTCSGFCPDSPVKVQEHTRRKMSAAYQKKMVSMVNNPDLSDVKIRTCDSALYAHRLILSVQCPSILSNCDVDVGLTEFSTDSVLAVLKFVYAGVICLPKGSVSEIKQLATRLEIDDLVEICSSVSDNKIDEDRMERNLKDPEEERDMTDLQHMLDEEVDLGEDEGCKSEKNAQEEISNEEYNDIRCTQRKKYSVPEAGWKGGGSEEVGEDAGEDSDISEAEISLFFHDDSFNGTSGEPCGDKVGSEGHSASENVEGIKEAKVTAQGQSMRTKNVEGRKTVTRKEEDESSADESVDDMEVDQGNEGNRKDKDEEKNRNSILYEDEDLIIYSETEDTPNCSGSEVDRRMSEVNHQSDDLERSGGVNSPLLVDSDDSSHNSLEENEESDGEGSPVLRSLDSSGLDLFESPLSSKLSSAVDDNQSGFQSPRIKSPAPCRENSFSPSMPPGKQSKICTPVKVFSRGGSRKIMRRSNLDRERYETRDQQESTDPRSKRVEDHVCISGGKSSVSTNSECEDDVVSLIDDQSESNGPEIKDSSPMLSKKQPIVSPVFSLPSKERKAFRFTKTKAVTASSQKITSPRITEIPIVIYCDDEKKPLKKSPSRQHKDDDEDLIATVEDEMGMDCQAADVWEDFDDSGMGGCVITCDFPAPSFSANNSKGEGSTSMKYTNPTTDPVTPINASSVSKRKSSCNIPAVQEGEENFGDDSFDVDMVLGQVAENQNFFKTPTDGRRPPKSRKEWIPPSPFTPMPEFEKMATPQLKQEVQKFGVKPVGKKRMLLLLKDVYKQTHQYETDSEFEMSVDEIVTEQNDESNPISVSDEEEISSSQDSQGSAVLEESMVAEEEEVTSSQIVSDVSELTQKISQYIHDTPDLHQRILQYEPLEFDSLKREITSAGIKCSMDKLMNFLDEKCITFTMKNRRKNSPRKRRKGSPKKGSKGSPKKGSKGSPKKGSKGSPKKGSGRGRKKTGDTE